MKAMGLVFALLAVFAIPVQALAATSNAYVVEEDWELRLDTPNITKNTPQIVTYFRIDADTYIVTCLNFRDQPVHDPGGIQIQLWDQGSLVDTVDVTLNSLDVAGDVARWTHVYRIAGGKLEAKLVGVNSQAWGQNINTSSIIQDPAGAVTFNTYNPDDSVAQSHVHYGRNALTWFGMTESRTYSDTGKRLSTDSTPRPVYAR